MQDAAKHQRLGRRRWPANDWVERRLRLGALPLTVTGLRHQVEHRRVSRRPLQAPAALLLGFIKAPGLNEEPGDLATQEVVVGLQLQRSPTVLRGQFRDPEAVGWGRLAAGDALTQVHAEPEWAGLARGQLAPPGQVVLGRGWLFAADLGQCKSRDDLDIAIVASESPFEKRLGLGDA